MESKKIPSPASTEKPPDLIMSIRATQQQMDDFGISIDGSKITRKGKPGKVENNTGTFAIPDAVFDFSANNSKEMRKPLRSEGEIISDNTVLRYSLQHTPNPNLHIFPNATHVSLNFYTPLTKPRPQMLGEYRASDYFELEITKKDGSRETFVFEPNLEISHS